MCNKYIFISLFAAHFTLIGCTKNWVPKEYDPHFKDDKITIKFKDNWWVLNKDLTFYIGPIDPDTQIQPSITVPAGFVTNLTSCPPIRDEPVYMKASILHDYMYWVHPCGNSNKSKSLSDKIYYQALKSSGANRFMSKTIKEAVAKWHKSGPWDNNLQSRNRGESRFIPLHRKKLWENVHNYNWNDFKNKYDWEQKDIEKIDIKTEKIPVCSVFKRFIE